MRKHNSQVIRLEGSHLSTVEKFALKATIKNKPQKNQIKKKKRIKLSPNTLTSSQKQSSKLFIVQKYPSTKLNVTNKVKFTVSGIQSKLTRHAKQQENMN